MCLFFISRNIHNFFFLHIFWDTGEKCAKTKNTTEMKVTTDMQKKYT